MDGIDKLIDELDKQIQDADTASLRAAEKGLSLGEIDLQSEAGVVRLERQTAERQVQDSLSVPVDTSQVILPPGAREGDSPEKIDYMRKKYDRSRQNFVETKDPNKVDIGDPVDTRTYFDPNTGDPSVYGVKYKGVPGEQFSVVGGQTAPARVEKYEVDVDGKKVTRFAGSEAPIETDEEPE